MSTSPIFQLFLLIQITNSNLIMKKMIITVFVLLLFEFNSNSQKISTGNPIDFKVKTCLHSVSYMGIWRGQATLTVDEFLLKAKELGFDGVMLAAKRPA